MNVRHTFKTTEPEKAALAFSAILAVDKGIPSDVVKDGENYKVISDENDVVLFEAI